MTPPSILEVLTTLPIFIFSFTCHQNMFPVANEITNPSVRRLTAVASSAVMTAVTLYAACIVFGYSVFGHHIKQNYLLALPQSIPVNLGSILMSLCNGLSLPLQTHPCRRSLTVLVNSCMGTSYEYPQVGERWLRRVLTSIILGGVLVVASLVDDLG